MKNSDFVFHSTFPGTRPVISDEKTRRFAYESLQAKYGRETEETPYVTLDDVAGFDDLPPYERYDITIDHIVRMCPIRFATDELICGSATLGAAAWHQIPAYYQGKLAFAVDIRVRRVEIVESRRKEPIDHRLEIVQIDFVLLGHAHAHAPEAEILFDLRKNLHK